MSESHVRNQRSFRLCFTTREVRDACFALPSENNGVPVVTDGVPLSLERGSDCGQLEGPCSFQRKHLSSARSSISMWEWGQGLRMIP